MKLQLTVCVLSLVILVCEAGLFDRKSTFTVGVDLGKFPNGSKSVNATVEIGMNNEKALLLFNGNTTWNLVSGRYRPGRLTMSTVSKISKIEDLTLKWSTPEDRPGNEEYMVVNFVRVYDKHKMQEFCPENKKIAKDSTEHFHKCF